MMLPDFDSGVWLLKYQQGFTGATIGLFDVASISPVSIPNLFTEEYIRIKTTSITAKDSWQRAGNLIQTIPTSLGLDDVIDIEGLSLKHPQIFRMTMNDDGYRLRLEFYKWLDDIDIRIDAWTL